MYENLPPASDDRGESPLGPAMAASASARGYRTRPMVIVIVSLCAAMAGAAVVALVAVGRHGSSAKAVSTEKVRVITPAPVVAGGLSQDYVVETQAGYQRQVSALRHKFSTLVGLTSSAIAIYTGQLPGILGPASYVTIYYLGFNTLNIGSTSRAVKSLLRNEALALHLINVTRVPIGGGPGDTAYGCETGIAKGRVVSVCSWATDRTFAVLASAGSDPHAKKGPGPRRWLRECQRC